MARETLCPACGRAVGVAPSTPAAAHLDGDSAARFWTVLAHDAAEQPSWSGAARRECPGVGEWVSRGRTRRAR